MPSSALRSRLEGGGTPQHSFVSDTLHVALASFFGPWGGVCEPAAEATKGVAVCFCRFSRLTHLDPKSVQRPRSAGACSRAHGTERSIDHTARTGEDPHLHTRKEKRPASDPTSTPRVCAVKLGTPHTSHDTSTTVPSTGYRPTALRLRLCSHACIKYYACEERL